MYLENDITGEIIESLNPQDGYSPATQTKIDAYLLIQAKIDKVQNLKIALKEFRATGFVYNSWTFNLSENSAFNVSSKNSLPSAFQVWTNTTDYQIDDLVIGSDSVIYQNLLDSNSGHDPVPTPTPNWKISDRFKYYDNEYVQHDLIDNEGFQAFTGKFLIEENRIMVLYNKYRNQIDTCTTIAELDAIVITFTP